MDFRVKTRKEETTLVEKAYPVYRKRKREEGQFKTANPANQISLTG